MTDTTEPLPVEERVARHLAARDWLTTEDRWDNATSSFRANYLSDAREVIALVRGAVSAVVPAADRAAPCRTTQHCAYHGWCHRCAPEFAAVMSRVNVAIQRTDSDERHWGPLYEAVAAELAGVLPAPADRAAVLLEAADRYQGFLDNADTSADPRYWTRIRDMVLGLRHIAVESAVVDRVAAETPPAETHQTVRCSLAVMRQPHGPHRWEPQPGMTPVRCPGACRCTHPADEHSVYGCVDGCPCEYLPARRPAVEAQPGKDTETRCVCGHTKGQHVTVSGRLLCDECAPDSTDNLVCKEFEAL
ncbi:hypothetical protein [Streptomyces scabiei]|uniref:hypothetical protein n=1 Tax=Streptomyces scabiei TaxID=1930 RepID=UPI000765F28E|nr:hypothetical protein [Streptomyces scabiei]